MDNYKKQFLQFAIQQGVLRFGDFELKSGRRSPYFFNAGAFNSGTSLARLGQYYAAALQASTAPFDMLYGPAYKGIPLAVTTCIALSDRHQRDIPFAFNRKEAKDHGEGGDIVGSPLRGRVMIIDDVISAGTSVRESFAIIGAHKAEVAGVIIALDRQERGTGTQSAIQQVESDTGVKVISVVCLADLLEYLQAIPEQQHAVAAIKTYRDQYGV